ncbi:MAG: type II toxin-antitoxin system HicA family toxin [Acidobacteriota bacterium]
MPRLTTASYQTLVKVFEKHGFAFRPQKGDHLIYAKPGVKQPLFIPMYQDVPVFIIKNLLRTSGMSRERYFDLLEKL